jgi:hypothetical protein
MNISKLAACLKNDKGELLPYTVQSTIQQCEEFCEKFFPAWERMKELGYKVVQVNIVPI